MRQATTHRAPEALLPLAADGVSLRGRNGAILDRLTLRLARSGVTVVMGPNGAGKSMLLKILHGLIAPDSGSVTWNGRPGDRSTRRRQAMLFQRPVLLRRSALANVRFALDSRGVRDAAVAAGLLERVGLAGRRDVAARSLSGGEQQRLALARALALRPEVLFMDEPTASLDPFSTLTIEEVVREQVRAGVKVIFVTHDVAQARRVADDVVFLHHGRVLEHADAAAFFERQRSAEARLYLAGEIVL